MTGNPPIDASTPDAHSSPEIGSNPDGAPDGSVEDGAIDVGAAGDANADTASDAGGSEAALEGASVGTADTGGGLTPCVSAPCAGGTVPCDGNTKHNEVCTATEALVVARDIAKGNVTGGKLNMNSCYECMLAIGCIDDDKFSSDVNHECGDLSTSAVALDGESYSQACLDTLSCMIDQKCTTGDPPAACFCGTVNTGPCFGIQGAANSACLSREVNGLPKVTGASCTMGSFASGGAPPNCTPGDLTGTDNDYIDSTEPSGMANSFMGCGYTNCKSECTP